MVLPFKKSFSPPFLHLTSLFVHASCQSPLTTRRGTKLPLGKTPAAASHGNSKPSVAGKIIAIESRWVVKGDNLEWKGGELLNVQGPVFVVGLAASGCQSVSVPLLSRANWCTRKLVREWVTSYEAIRLFPSPKKFLKFKTSAGNTVDGSEIQLTSWGW